MVRYHTKSEKGFQQMSSIRLDDIFSELPSENYVCEELSVKYYTSICR